MTRNSPSNTPGATPSPPKGSEISSTTPSPRASSTTMSRMISSDAADTREDPGAGGGDQQTHSAQSEHLPAGGGRLPEALHGILEGVGSTLSERQGGVGHAPDLHPLLRAGGGDGALEVGARLLGVEALGGTPAEDGHRGGLVLDLALELLVGALLERLDGLHRAALLDPDLSLLGCHRGAFYGLRRCVPVRLEGLHDVRDRTGSKVLGGRGRKRYPRWRVPEPMRPPSITHLTATAITALALAVPGVADAAVFAPPPGATRATAPTTTPAPARARRVPLPARARRRRRSTPAPSATPKVSTGQAKGAAPGRGEADDIGPGAHSHISRDILHILGILIQQQHPPDPHAGGGGRIARGDRVHDSARCAQCRAGHRRSRRRRSHA